MRRFKKWFLTMGLVLVMSFSSVGSTYAFLDDLFESIESFFSSAEDFISSIVTSFNYTGGNLTSIMDWATGTVTYFAGGDPTFSIGLVPDAYKLYQWLVDQGYEGDFKAWINENYEDFASLDLDENGTIEGSELYNIGAIAAYLEEKQEMTSDKIMELIAENSTQRITYFVYNEQGILEFNYFYITDEKGNLVEVGGDYWDPYQGIIDGKRAQVTLYDNGRISKIVGWNKDGETDSWQTKFATFVDSDNDGITDYAQGALDLIGVNIPQAAGFTADYGKVIFDSLGRISEVYIDPDDDGDFEQLAAKYTYDAQGRVTAIDVYDKEEIIAKVEMSYVGNNLSTQTIKTKDDSGSLVVQSITSYYYGDNNVLLYTKTITQGERTEEVAEQDKDEDLNGDGDKLDTIRYTYETTTTTITWFLFGRNIFTTENTEETLVKNDIVKDVDPHRDPAVTGTVTNIAGIWHVNVIVWTNPEKTVWEEVEIVLDLSLLSEEKRKEIEAVLEEYAQSGEQITLYGLTATGEITPGCVLQVLGLGKGPFEEHPFDF